MEKYWTLIKNTWNEALVYRLNFVLWRVRIIIRFLITYFLWSTILKGTSSIFGYSKEQMFTYIFLVYVVGNFVFATRTQDIGDEINEGRLTNYLLRPMGFFKSMAARDVSDKVLNFSFTLVEFILFLIIFKPPFFLQTNPFILFSFGVAFLGAVGIYFLISMLLGFVGFWSNELWGIRFIFFIISEFLAGNYFPIDIFPPFIVKVLVVLPFSYMFYFPVKLYLGQLSNNEILGGMAILIFWLIVLSWAVSFFWKRGLKVYSAEGR